MTGKIIIKKVQTINENGSTRLRVDLEEDGKAYTQEFDGGDWLDLENGQEKFKKKLHRHPKNLPAISEPKLAEIKSQTHKEYENTEVQIA